MHYTINWTSTIDAFGESYKYILFERGDLVNNKTQAPCKDVVEGENLAPHIVHRRLTHSLDTIHRITATH